MVMKRLFCLLMFPLCILPGCKGDDGAPATSTGPSDETPLDDPGLTGSEIAAGTVALFLSLSLDGRDESWPTIDGNITWEETDIGVLRYLPEGAALDIFASTTSTSFSANHIYPLTIGHRTFVVSTRGRK